MQKTLFIIFPLIFFITLGVCLEQSVFFSPLKSRLQDMTIPSPLLNFGKRGQIMEKLGIKYAIPENYTRFFNPEAARFEMQNIIKLDTTGLKLSKSWCAPNQVAPEKLPSTLIMNKKIISQRIPILSVVVDDHDLYDPETGIFENNKKKGREWERPCFISYFENGKLLFASGAGIRVHGEKKEKGFRLYFRDIYGFDQFKPGILFDNKSEPLKHIVVHDDTRGKFHFNNPLAYDVSEKIGCIVPHTKPVKVYLNGSVHGKISYSMTEHLSKEYLISHFGHDNFVFVRSKGRKRLPIEYKNMHEWAHDKDTRMTMEEVKQHVNLDNLSRWHISQLFCSNTDAYQGLTLLDKSKSDSKWFWINWDMDHSFRNKYETELKNIWEQERAFDVLVYHRKDKTNDPRITLFRRLINEDPRFRKYFEGLFMDAMNHRITPVFLNSRVKHYEKIALSFGFFDMEYINQIRLFLDNRPAFIRKLMKKYFNSPESYLCIIKGPDNIEDEIDGYSSSSGYKGWYFKGSQISIKVNDDRKTVSYWLVNGKKYESYNNKLIYTVVTETIVKPVFKH